MPCFLWNSTLCDTKHFGKLVCSATFCFTSKSTLFFFHYDPAITSVAFCCIWKSWCTYSNTVYKAEKLHYNTLKMLILYVRETWDAFTVCGKLLNLGPHTLIQSTGVPTVNIYPWWGAVEMKPGRGRLMMLYTDSFVLFLCFSWFSKVFVIKQVLCATNLTLFSLLI